MSSLVNNFPHRGREGRGAFEFECAPSSHMLIHLLPKDASGSIKIPDPLA